MRVQTFMRVNGEAMMNDMINDKNDYTQAGPGTHVEPDT
jgi:hypothetical protein